MGVRPQSSHGVFLLTMLSMAVCQPSNFLTAQAIAKLLPPFTSML
jgi:hypothetical protein